MIRPDLRIIISFADGGVTSAPEGPGWYLSAIRIDPDLRLSSLNSASPMGGVGHEEIIPPVRLSAQEITKLGRVIEKFAEGKPLNWRDHPPFTRGEVSLVTAISEENERAKGLLARELAEAERAIKNLEILRLRAEEFNDGES